MLKLIFTRKFLLHGATALLVFCLALTGAYFFLLNYTRQDAIVEVPDLHGYDIVEAESVLKELSLEGLVIDSLYLPGKRKGEVVDQQPIPGSSIKQHRKIYLTITRFSSPMVKLPNILDQTLPLVIAKLNSYGIEVGEIMYKPSECTDCVLGASIRGKSVKIGAPLSKGQRVDLIVGAGASSERISIPIVYGLSAGEAEKLLAIEGLNLGATVYLDCETSADSASAKIFRQTPAPEPANKIARGASIDVYLSNDLSKIPPVSVDSLKAQINP
jgi:beta-lactam-binding protein with PASTA domain